MNKVETHILTKYEPLLQEMGLEFADVEYVKEGKNWFLRLFIDQISGEPVQLEHCEKASRLVSAALDDDEGFPVDRAYILEVSSPGIERVLKRPKDFEKFIGSQVQIRLYQARENQKNFIGFLDEATEEGIRLRVGEDHIPIRYTDIAKANIYFEF